MINWQDPEVDNDNVARIPDQPSEMKVGEDDTSDTTQKTLLQTGLVKVTDVSDSTGSYRVFAVSSEFKGQTNDWYVTSGIQEVTLKK